MIAERPKDSALPFSPPQESEEKPVCGGGWTAGDRGCAATTSAVVRAPTHPLDANAPVAPIVARAAAPGTGAATGLARAAACRDAKPRGGTAGGGGPVAAFAVWGWAGQTASSASAFAKKRSSFQRLRLFGREPGSARRVRGKSAKSIVYPGAGGIAHEKALRDHASGYSGLCGKKTGGCMTRPGHCPRQRLLERLLATARPARPRNLQRPAPPCHNEGHRVVKRSESTMRLMMQRTWSADPPDRSARDRPSRQNYNRRR